VATYARKRRGCAKKSAYISSSDRLSRMKVGRTTLVRSMPSFTLIQHKPRDATDVYTYASELATQENKAATKDVPATGGA